MYIVLHFFQEWVRVIKKDYFVINQRLFLVTFLQRENDIKKKDKSTIFMTFNFKQINNRVLLLVRIKPYKDNLINLWICVN